MRKSRADFGSGQWFDVLKAAGNLESRKETPFTASMLSKEAKMKSTAKIVTVEENGKAKKKKIGSDANQIAAAWLLKLEKWGYVERTGTAKGDGPRPVVLWQMTDKGKECKLRESLQSRYGRLLETSRNLVAARGKKDEATMWKALTDLIDEVGV